MYYGTYARMRTVSYQAERNYNKNGSSHINDTDKQNKKRTALTQGQLDQRPVNCINKYLIINARETS